MRAGISALLVHDREDRLETVKLVLETIGVTALRARTWKEVEARLCETPSPHVVLTDTVLSDGNWLDVLDSAAKAPERVNVIVASRNADVSLYLDVMTQGAFDFVTDSFTVRELVRVLRCAIDNAVQCRAPQKGSPWPRGTEQPELTEFVAPDPYGSKGLEL